MTMLKEEKVIALPNPPYYPRANGKHERSNQAVRQWLLPFTSKAPDRDEILHEAHLALVDNNEYRRKEVLGKRTPGDVYRNTPRVMLDRSMLYAGWEEWRQKLQGRTSGRILLHGPWEAMRIAAMIVLRKYRLVRYFISPEAPKSVT